MIAEAVDSWNLTSSDGTLVVLALLAAAFLIAGGFYWGRKK